MNEGIFKIINGTLEEINQSQFILWESWKKTRDRLQREYPNAKIKYSYKTKQFTIYYSVPNDLKILQVTCSTQS